MTNTILTLYTIDYTNRLTLSLQFSHHNKTDSFCLMREDNIEPRLVRSEVSAVSNCIVLDQFNYLDNLLCNISGFIQRPLVSVKHRNTEISE